VSLDTACRNVAQQGVPAPWLPSVSIIIHPANWPGYTDVSTPMLNSACPDPNLRAVLTAEDVTTGFALRPSVSGQLDRLDVRRLALGA